MNILPALSNAMPFGLEQGCACCGATIARRMIQLVAGEFPGNQSARTLRTRKWRVSAIRMLPWGSSATPLGRLKSALVAGPLSPENPAPMYGLTLVWQIPAIVEMIPLTTFHAAVQRCRRYVHVTGSVCGDPRGQRKESRLVAGPWSPEYP